MQNRVALEEFTAYLGEKVRIGVWLSNVSDEVKVNNVSIKVVIKSKRMENVVVDSDAIIADQVKIDERIDDPLRQFAIDHGPGKVKGFAMQPKMVKEYLIPLTISDIGTYRMFVQVGYEVESGIGYRFEKNLKFEATKAIKLNPILHPVCRAQSLWIAELTVNNAAQEHILIEKVTLQAQPKFVSTNLNRSTR